MIFQIKTMPAILITVLAFSMSAVAQNQARQSDDSIAKVVQKQKAKKARIVLTDDDLPRHATAVADVQPMNNRSIVEPAPAESTASSPVGERRVGRATRVGSPRWQDYAAS